MVQAYFYETDSLTQAAKVIDRLLDNITAGCHGDNDSIGVRISHIIEKIV